MNLQQRHLTGVATTRDARPTHLLTLPAFPAEGSFSLTGTLLARRTSDGRVTAFFPVNSGSIVAGVVAQCACGDHGSRCNTAPADGGAAQGFAPYGCSSLTNGHGQTMPLHVTGLVGSLFVLGLDETEITWSWDLTLDVVSS